MKYKITHETHYKFSSEVFFEPHYLRFKPKTTPNNRTESFFLEIQPTPVGISEQLDAENNSIHFCWFEGLNSDFSIRTESLVITEEYNPFNFIIYPVRYLNFPIAYEPGLKRILTESLETCKIDTSLQNFGNNVLQNSNANTVEFLTNLTRQIHSDFILETREEGSPYNPEDTFALKKGSCRDIAWMQIQLLRHMGLAARFVSGYYYIPMEKPEFELHAWIEVFLPGAGWIGFDPSHGIIAGNTHIPIASSCHFENTMTVTGTIRGDASSELVTSIYIEAID
jgi:transglutaminase-like putative cysteine protease